MTNNSIWGILAPKFLSGTTEVLLDYINVNKNEPEPVMVLHTSPLTGFRTWVISGEHWVYQITMNLFQVPDPQAVYQAINAHKYALVKLWMRRDRDCVKDAAGNDILFKIEEITPYWLDTPQYYDKLIITFRSQKFIDISKSINATIVDDKGSFIEDDNSNILIQ